MSQDESIEHLLDLDGVRYVIDEELGVWIKFEAKRVVATKDRPHGVRYSLTLHDRTNQRIMGFDNAHAIEYGGKRNVAAKKRMITCMETVMKFILINMRMRKN